MKNDIFSFRRFGKYFATDVRTCTANYGLSLATISILSPIVLYVISIAFNLVLKSTWDGPGMGMRFFVFAIAMLCMIVTMPVKCYGKITEKQYGSFWLTLPASRLEKFISMIIMTSIIVPVLGAAIYIGIDAVICVLDPTCGRNLIAGGLDLIRNLGEMQDLTMNFVDENITIEDADVVQEILRQVSTPWIYLDEIFGITLPFLLGAVFFKNGKTVKTILAIFAVSTAVSIIASPLMANWAAEIVNNANSDPMAIVQFFSTGPFRNLILLDTISDTIVNLGLIAGIWFRIKTLKH